MAEWRVFGETLLTADFSGSPVYYQPFTLNQNTVLKAIRTWVVVYNSPSFTSLGLRIYSSVSSAPAQLIATSDTTWTLAQITSEANAVREIYFEFNNALSLNGEDQYHVVLWGNGYTGTDSSHVAWVRAFPDPVNSGYTPAIETINRAPFKVAFIGDDL